MHPLSITFLGTGSAYPTPKRGSSCTVVNYGGDLWMFDCGEGTQTQVMKSELKPGKISKIFITHLHGDHLYGLPGLLCTISQSNQRDEPVDVIGPVGLAKYLRTSLGLARSQLGFQFTITELMPTGDMYRPEDSELCNMDPGGTELNPCEIPGRSITHSLISNTPVWDIVTDGPLTVRATKLTHRIPSFGFVINEQEIPGKFDVSKAQSLGLPLGPLCARLKAGESIMLEDGRCIQPEQVVGPPKKGRCIVMCGDSSDSSALVAIANQPDAFVHEATYQNSMREMAIERGHSTPTMAAEFALSCNARQLFLTHFSQRYRDDATDGKDEFLLSTIAKEAMDVFGNQVVVARDLDSHTIKCSGLS